ncbi:MAG: prepilin-type N-terminal cleavage/methylation domain-containing protein [Fimbriimonadaceae bacterium]|nr:prepilin-type N-terminal cleavage/methylation domain-containing protein [Fimbriimonadaceae bacterium]QYK55349.1 MAG: prepilin-type N-terminal cleavage/methylation domain-containing protein [Fimbriimonadaceae bacterium]
MKRAAFTLIELLVVIAIIAILAAILFPVFSQAKESAKISQQLSQQRQLSLSVMMYASDYDDNFVPASNRWVGMVGDPIIWTEGLESYVKNQDLFVAVASNGAAAKNWATRRQQTVGYSDATGVDQTAPCTPNAATVGCEGFPGSASFSVAEEVSKTGLFATTPGAPIGNNTTKHRGYVFNPYNGQNDPGGEYKYGLPLISDRDLVTQRGDKNYPNSPDLAAGALKPIFARYRADRQNGGVTPVIFADGHAKVMSANAMNTFGNVIWRFR